MYPLLRFRLRDNAGNSGEDILHAVQIPVCIAQLLLAALDPTNDLAATI
jgi:hypothetical protein